MKINLKNRDKYIVLSLILIGLVLRFYYLYHVQFKSLVYDAKFYNLAAIKLLDTGILSFNSNKPNAYVTPLYPMFLALIYKIFGVRLLFVRVTQAFLSVFTMFIVYKIAKEYLNDISSKCVLFIMAIYPSFIYANGMILSEVLFTFLFMLFIYFFIKAMKTKKTALIALDALIFGIILMVRPTPSFLILPMFAYFFIIEIDKKLIVKQFFIFVAIVFLVISPWAIRNYKIYNKVIFFSTSSAHPLLWGTHPYAYNFSDVSETYKKVKLKGHNELLQNNAWKKEAINRIEMGMKNNPSIFIKWYVFGKTQHFWFSPWVEDYTISKFLSALRIPIHIMILITGFLGIAFSVFKNKKDIHFLAFTPIYFTLVHDVYLGIPRYAYPTIPIMIILGIYFLQEIIKGISKVYLSKLQKKGNA